MTQVFRNFSLNIRQDITSREKLALSSFYLLSFRKFLVKCYIRNIYHTTGNIRKISENENILTILAMAGLFIYRNSMYAELFEKNV